jgi:hypothetical protein
MCLGLLGARMARDAEQRSWIIHRHNYRTGEKAAGISNLFSCRSGRTPVWGGHWPPGLRDASRMRARSWRSLYTQVWTNLFSPTSSLVQQAARADLQVRGATPSASGRRLGTACPLASRARAAVSAKGRRGGSR